MLQEVWDRQNWQQLLHFWWKSKPGLPLKMTKEDQGDKMHPATSLSCQPPPHPHCGRENTDMRRFLTSLESRISEVAFQAILGVTVFGFLSAI